MCTWPSRDWIIAGYENSPCSSSSSSVTCRHALPSFDTASASFAREVGDGL